VFTEVIVKIGIIIDIPISVGMIFEVVDHGRVVDVQ
jgi:hypothetical protein